VDDLIGIGVAVCVAFLYLMFAGAVAALGAVVGAGEAVATFVSRPAAVIRGCRARPSRRSSSMSVRL
jgi:hypothetical protein